MLFYSLILVIVYHLAYKYVYAINIIFPEPKIYKKKYCPAIIV